MPVRDSARNSTNLHTHPERGILASSRRPRKSCRAQLRADRRHRHWRMSSANQSHFVSFPTSESVSTSPLPVPHLPFRRISLPTTPSPALAAHRQSVASLASLDSLAEESVVVHQHRRVKRRSLNPTRPHRRTQADDDRHVKRSQIISEFYATEKSYLNGLDLVYNVCICILTCHFT